MAARDVQFIRHVYLGAHTIEIKKHIQTCLNDQNPESFEDMIIILLMFNNIDCVHRIHTRSVHYEHYSLLTSTNMKCVLVAQVV